MPNNSAYFSLDPMRRHAILFCFLISWACAPVQADVVSEYQALTGEMAHSAIRAALWKHPERWTQISMKLRYGIDDRGHIHDITISSATPNRWAEETIRRVLSQLRLPPVPKKLLSLVGIGGLYADSKIQLSK
jgi:muconolactone delta-isomerase